MERDRYTLSAFKNDEETCRPVSLNFSKTEHMLTEAKHYAKHMLDILPEATFIEIFDHKSMRPIERVTRL